MDTKIEMLAEAIGNAGSGFLEEALATRRIKRRAVRLQRITAACIALAVVAVCTVSVLAVKYWIPSWKDLFGTEQNVIGSEDEASLPPDSVQIKGDLDLDMQINSVLSDERILYIMFTLRSRDGTPLDRSGRFKDYRMYFPDKMMSGGYQYYFLAPSDTAAPGELGGVIYADWQADPTVKSAVISFTDWMEPEKVDSVKVEIDIADMVEKAGSNARLEPLRHTFGNDVRYLREGYLWQPAGGQTELPGSNGVFIDNLGWEDGMLHIVLKGPCEEYEWLTGGVTEVPMYADPDIYNRQQHWFFIDSRTGEKLFVELNENGFASPVDLGEAAEDPDWQYAWQFLKVAKEDLPYLELYCGGDSVNVTKWAGTREISVDLPVTMPSEVLVRNVPIDFKGEKLTIDRIECSKMSMAVYFPGYVDSTTGIMNSFAAWDKDGELIDCNWYFNAEQSDRECMVWTYFKEPMDPADIYTVTYLGRTIFTRQ